MELLCLMIMKIYDDPNHFDSDEDDDIEVTYEEINLKLSTVKALCIVRKGWFTFIAKSQIIHRDKDLKIITVPEWLGSKLKWSLLKNKTTSDDFPIDEDGEDFV